jgi:thiol-disulfide isomerase/thioredoxin
MSKFKFSDPFTIRAGLIFLAFLSLACDRTAPPRPVSEVGTATAVAKKGAGPAQNERAIAEAFDVPISRLDGTTFKLADFKGKVMLVDFWATFCPPCVKQAPQLAELNKRYRDRGFEVIGLTSDEKSDQAKVEEFIKRAGINYTIGYANNWVSRAFLRWTEDNSGSPPLPQLFLISRDGRVIEHLVGDSPQHGLPYLEKMVNQELSLNAASR